jgi:hypothetical protein
MAYPNPSFDTALKQHLDVRGGCSMMDDVTSPAATPFSGLIDDTTFVCLFYFF